MRRLATETAKLHIRMETFDGELFYANYSSIRLDTNQYYLSVRVTSLQSKVLVVYLMYSIVYTESPADCQRKNTWVAWQAYSVYSVQDLKVEAKK